MHNKSDQRHITRLGELASAAYVALVAVIAQSTGLTYVLFPELGALSYDILKRPHGAWAKAPLMLILTPFLTALIGTLITQHFAYNVASVLLIVSSSIIVISMLRSPVAPAISAGLLPLTLGASSWWYPPSLLVGTILLAAIAMLRSRIGPQPVTPPSNTYLADHIIEQRPSGYSWVFFFAAFLIFATVVVGFTGWKFVLFPPLVVIAFEMFAHDTVCPWARRPLSLLATCALTATASVTIITFFGSGPLAAMCSILFSVVTLRIFNLHVPPVLAVGLLPFIISQPSYEFPIAVFVGATLLLIFFLAWRQFARQNAIFP